ncbi:hypothetical protein VTK56DRAFT_5907 [Thermocarpiscus australiensis]
MNGYTDSRLSLTPSFIEARARLTPESTHPINPAPYQTPSSQSLVKSTSHTLSTASSDIFDTTNNRQPAMRPLPPVVLAPVPPRAPAPRRSLASARARQQRRTPTTRRCFCFAFQRHLGALGQARLAGGPAVEGLPAGGGGQVAFPPPNFFPCEVRFVG